MVWFETVMHNEPIRQGPDIIREVLITPQSERIRHECHMTSRDIRRLIQFFPTLHIFSPCLLAMFKLLF
jgi:hypothetical protein